MMQELNYIRCGDYYIPDIRLHDKLCINQISLIVQNDR